MIRQLWRIWAKSLGPKASENNLEADQAALIRTGMALLYMTTCLFVIADVIRHW